jgi:hypothetical protein
MDASDAAAAGGNWEYELANLLGELANVQSELLDVLEAKRVCMGRSDWQGTDELRPRAERLLERLQSCHDRRARLLESTARPGESSPNLKKLSMRATSENREKMARQVKDASRRMRHLQQQSLGNWVLAQRTLLHVAQMLEIIANGGRLQPTYGKGEPSSSGGALVDHAA